MMDKSNFFAEHKNKLFEMSDELNNVIKESLLGFITSEKEKKFGYEFEDKDTLYRVYVTMRAYDKHTCDDCIYNLGDECYYKDYSICDWKRYCKHYSNHKACWECKNYNNYGYDDSWCDIDMERNLKYSYDYNKYNECPDWELDV